MPEPDINPPSTYSRYEVIDCPFCDTEIAEPVAGEPCPGCGRALEADTIRDQLEAQSEPPEWA